MQEFLIVVCGTLGAMLVGAGVLHLLPRLGSAGRAVWGALYRAPLLDLPIAYFTVLPLVVGPIYAGWLGLVGAFVGQAAASAAWGVARELWHEREGASRRRPNERGTVQQETTTRTSPRVT